MSLKSLCFFVQYVFKFVRIYLSVVYLLFICSWLCQIIHLNIAVCWAYKSNFILLNCRYILLLKFDCFYVFNIIRYCDLLLSVMFSDSCRQSLFVNSFQYLYSVLHSAQTLGQVFSELLNNSLRNFLRGYKNTGSDLLSIFN